jgi:hypothetical protein
MNGKTLGDHHVDSRATLPLQRGKPTDLMYSFKEMTTTFGINGGTEDDGVNGRILEHQEEALEIHQVLYPGGRIESIAS